MPERIWIDTEFNASSWDDFDEYKRGELISMALVAENGMEWYECLKCDAPSDWIRNNVLPILGKPTIDIAEFRHSLSRFLCRFNVPVIIADWPEDIAYLCDALITGAGSRIKTPELTFVVANIPSESDAPHNALADARAIKKAFMRQRA